MGSRAEAGSQRVLGPLGGGGRTLLNRSPRLRRWETEVSGESPASCVMVPLCARTKWCELGGIGKDCSPRPLPCPYWECQSHNFKTSNVVRNGTHRDGTHALEIL